MEKSSVGEHYVPSSNIRSAADIERAAAGVIDIDAKTTAYVVLACIVAASGGVLFGYDGGITGAVSLIVTVISTRPQRVSSAGGVETMDQFKSWFFPIGGDKSLYCKYNNESLQAYSAVMHFTGSIASIAASYFTQHWGRKG